MNHVEVHEDLLSEAASRGVDVQARSAVVGGSRGLGVSGSPGMSLETVMATFDVLQERRRQIEVEGFDAAADDARDGGELAQAAACYALNAGSILLGTEVEPFSVDEEPIATWWPLLKRWWKPHKIRRDLVRAAALIIAEIERLDRSASRVSLDGADSDSKEHS